MGDTIMEGADRPLLKIKRVNGAPVLRPTESPAPLPAFPAFTSVEQLEIKRQIGSTQFADVFVCEEKTTRRTVALKRLNKATLSTLPSETAQTVRQSWETEVTVHSRLKHPFIVELYGDFEDSTARYLVMQYCNHGDLATYLDGIDKLSEEDTAFYVKQAAYALAFLHSHDPVVLHRDIKLENCLIDADRNLRLSDFGSVGLLFDQDQRRETLCGTLDYLAPEFLKKRGISQKADVWALGVATYELLTGSAPFAGYDDQQSTCAAIARAEVMIPEHLTSECRDFLASTLNGSEDERLTMVEVCTHPYLSKYFANFGPAPRLPGRVPLPQP